MTDKPRIRIVSDGFSPNTHVTTEDGVEIPGITSVDLHIDTSGPATAKLQAVALSADMLAVLTALQIQTLPPLSPKVQYRFRITEGSKTADRWILEKLIPLPTFGVKEEFVCGGALPKGGPLIELIGDAPEVEVERSEDLPDENVIYEAP